MKVVFSNRIPSIDKLGNFPAILLVVCLFFLNFSFAQDQQQPNDSLGNFGGPDQVDNRIERDKEVVKAWLEFPFLDGYFSFKERFAEQTDLTFGLDYSNTFIGTNSDLGEGNASSGVFRFYGSWEPVGKKSGNTGALVFKVEHRHKYGDIPPKGLGLDMGYVGFIGAAYNNDGWRATNLYWRQRFADGRVALVGGFLDVTDFFDVYGLAVPWMHFSNLVFSTGVAAVNLPNDGYLGFAAGGWITKKVYAIVGLGDINADPTDIFNGFDTFFNKNEYFKHLEVGVAGSQDYLFLDNIHLSLWQRDATSATGDPNGWGLVLSASKYINETWYPFLRYAYTEDAGSLLQNSLSTGFGYQPVQGRDLLALGLNWGQVNETTFGPGLDDQFSFELFYRFQLSTRVAITPDLQYLINPALNPQQSSLFLYSIRGRIVL